MPSALTLGGFLATATIASLAWGRALWYFAERSQALRRWVFFILGYTQRQMGEVRALLLSAIYYVLGLLLALSLALGFGLKLSSLVSFSANHLGLAVLGAIGEISLANLLVDLGSRLFRQGGPERFAEIQEIPWINGLQQLPPAMIPIAAATGGVIEEIVFRGVVQRVLSDKFALAPLLAIAIAGALFCFEQVLQLRTTFQVIAVGGGCVAISLVGGALVALTGSMLPALFAHASFVLFFMAQGSKSTVGAPPRAAERAAR